MTLINEEPEGRKTTRVLLAKMSAGALMAFCELLERGDLEQGDELVYVNCGGSCCLCFANGFRP